MNSAPRSPSRPLSSRTLLALTEALEHSFDAAAWARLGAELEMPQLIDPDLRLQESLRSGDDDYGYCVAQFVRHLEAERPADLHDLAHRAEIRAWLDANAPGAVQELALGRTLATTSAVASEPASKAAEQALIEAHHVLNVSGPVSGIHRSHDALQRYLLAVAARANPNVAADATVAQLYWALVNDHPAFAAQIRRTPQVGHVLASLVEAVTALNTLRDEALAEHEDHATHGGTEAALMTDLTRTLFNYLRGRL